MKNLLLISALISFNLLTAQYNINWEEAPLNRVPIPYKLEHFNIKGPIKEYKHLGTVIFNKDGYVESGKNIIDYAFTYDSTGKPLSYITYYDGVKSNAGKLILDSKGRIIESDIAHGRKFSYDKNGNWTGTFSVQTGERANSSFIDKYDDKNRVIASQYFNKEIFYEDNFSYKKEDDFLIVTTTRVFLKNKNKNKTTINYYKDGYYYGETKNDKVKFDQYGNQIVRIDANGIAKIVNPETYIYFENNVSPDLKRNIAKKTETPLTKDTNCTAGNCFDGYGTYELNNGSYTGFFKDGKRDGFGTYRWSTGASYAGMWQNNLRHGYGSSISESGVIIEGTFQFDLLTGLGIKIFTDKTSERGHYVDGVLVTKYNYYDNKVKKGCLIGDCKDGFGKFLFDDDAQYVGFYKKGFMYQGVWVAANGDTYSGQFGSNNNFDIYGVDKKKNGDIYFGEYRNGKRHGRGLFYNRVTTVIKKGEWKDGELVKDYRSY